MDSDLQMQTVPIDQAIIRLLSYIDAAKTCINYFNSDSPEERDWCLKTAEESPYVAYYENLRTWIVRLEQGIRDAQKRGVPRVDARLCRFEV
jgi:hypothetical protein